MFEFKTRQRVITIGKVKVGGFPGENPTVLIGTIFYLGHKIVIDDKRGEFDKKKAEELINNQERMSDLTGNPAMIDVVGNTEEAIRKYIDFVAGVTDMPILVDSISADVRLKGMKYAMEVGLSDRVVYNSLLPDFKKEEINGLKEIGVRNIVLLTFTSDILTTRGRLVAFKNLLDAVTEIGINNIMVDTCVIDVPSLGLAMHAIFKIKDEFGYPAGCGAHNAVATWRGLRRKMGDIAVKPALAVASTIPVVIGADFILYGPIEHADIIFPTVAMVDAIYGFMLRERGIKVGKEHPLFKIA